eukprot:m.211177 g.211177  ORF g.211177 m.211177 type:complete len:162 (+) comp17891_c0_seq1:66-551(+)
MNKEKLSQLQAQVRIGGKGTARRKKKVVHKTASTDDKKLQNTLKKLGANTISGTDEVNMIKDDGTVIHFVNPKVQAAVAAHTFSISGPSEVKPISELLPSIISQLGVDSIDSLKRMAESLGAGAGAAAAGGDDDDDVPALVNNFEDVANAGAKPAPATASV